MGLLPLTRATLKTIFSGALRIGRCRIVQLHGEANALSSHIHLGYFDFYNVAGLHDFTRIRDEFVAKLTDVNQAVLVNTQINKGTKGSHVAHCAF
jgi:hypothetical protein